MPTRTLVLAITLSLLASPAFAQIGNVSVEGSVDLVSHYVFRGVGFTNKPTAQPSLTVGFGESGFSFNIWGSAALKQRSIQDAGDELDFTISYDRNLGEQYENLALSFGMIQYTFPSLAKGERLTTEFFAGASLDVAGSPSVTIYRDLGQFDYWYINGSIGHEIGLTPEGNVTLGFAADVAYSDTTDKLEFNHVGASVSVGVSHSYFSLSPTIGLIRRIEDIVEDGGEPTRVWGGVSLGFAL